MPAKFQLSCSTSWKATVLMLCALWFAGTLLPGPCFGESGASSESPSPSPKGDDQVLRHAVFFKFKDSSTEADVDRIVELFRALPTTIEEIQRFQAGENVSRLGFSDGLTHCFLLSFKDEAARAVYLPHPDHKAFGAAIGPHLDKVFVLDYWGQQPPKSLEREFKRAVFIKFKDNASDEEVRTAESQLAALPTKIDAIKALEWGTNNSPETHDQGFTHCFMLTFDSEDGLRKYASHPAHAAVVDNLRPFVEQIRVFDFWADDAPPRDE